MPKSLLLLIFAAIAMVSGGAFVVVHAPAIVWASTYIVEGVFWLLTLVEHRKR